MRCFFTCMNRIRELNERISCLAKLNPENLLQRAINLEKQNFELQNILAKVNHGNVPEGAYRRSNRLFEFDKYKKRCIALQVCYLGWEYSGVVVQGDNHTVTVMDKVLDCLEKCRLIEDRSACKLTVCGRTDKGVSALGQVISLVVRSVLKDGVGILSESGCRISERTDEPKEELDYVMILNSVLPHDIRILAWSPVSEEFSARFTCTGRSYSYVFPISGLNLDAMKDACLRLKGIHDFRNFCSVQVEGETVNCLREVFDITVEPLNGYAPSRLSDPSTLYELTLSASSFLYHQVRCIIAILILIGRGKEEPSIVDYLLDTDNNLAKPQYQMASDLPLTLIKADYPEGELNWMTTEAAQLGLIRHFQKGWTEQSIRASTIKIFMKHVQDRFQAGCDLLHHLDRIIPEGRWYKGEELSERHRPLRTRPVELTVEEKVERAKIKRQRKLSDICATPSTSDSALDN